MNKKILRVQPNEKKAISSDTISETPHLFILFVVYPKHDSIYKQNNWLNYE